MLDELEDLKKRYASLLTSLSDPGIASDPHKLRTVSKERSDLEPIVSKYEEYLHLKKELRDSRELLNDPNTEAELRDLADQECKGLEDRLEAVEEGLKYLLLPKDPNDEKNVFLEIRAGAGGDEASLFAQDLFRMYTRFAETVGWRFEVMSSSYSPVGGLKEIIVNIKGKRVFSRLKYESGVHRVQRVPQTEASGRIHTSTVTVAVLPEADEVDIRLDPKDLRIEAFGASGPGGQSVNRNYTAIRITHRPSGMVVSCQDEKSQHRNKERALRVLRSRLLDIVQSEQQQEIADNRKSQVGTGKRSEKIRTYNFPQSRVTDHRLNLSLHKLEAVLDGDLADFLDALTVHNQTEMIGRVSSGLEN
ncbi:MAG: peptide chain release factor 1 [Acidobacteria bacterium]|nr:peptide chain release factor 1 [Acidobacteriota bacterium]